MSESIKEVKAVMNDLTNLKRSLDTVSDSLKANTAEVTQINKQIEAEKIKEEKQKPKWNKVSVLSESERYPLVKTSDAGIKVEADLVLKKLDII